jgi:hypothetical protein
MTWRALAERRSPLILVPTMADVAAEAALGGSHHILIPVTGPASAVIELPWLAVCAAATGPPAGPACGGGPGAGGRATQGASCLWTTFRTPAGQSRLSGHQRRSGDLPDRERDPAAARDHMPACPSAQPSLALVVLGGLEASGQADRLPSRRRTGGWKLPGPDPPRSGNPWHRDCRGERDGLRGDWHMFDARCAVFLPAACGEIAVIRSWDRAAVDGGRDRARATSMSDRGAGALGFRVRGGTERPDDFGAPRT